MTATLSQSSPAQFQLATANTWASPWSMYKSLRDHDPVHHVVPEDKPDHDYYVMSRHADIWAAARDHETFSSAQGLTVNYGELDLIGLADNPPMVMQDPPVHTEFRKLVSRGFTPRQVEAVEPKVREYVVERIESIACRTAAATSSPNCSSRCRRWSSRTTSACRKKTATSSTAGPRRSSRPTPSRAASQAHWSTLGDALGEMMAYFTALIERRRTEPEDDTVSHLVAAGVGADGDIAGVLSILAFTFTMVTGGNDTTTGMLGGSVQLLHQRPDQRKLLAENPDLIPDSIDEFLRLTSPVQMLGRDRDPRRDGRRRRPSPRAAA